MGDAGFRVGFGYDIHRLVEGRKLVLGGVEIPFGKGLLGHSDADVLLHAVCDALLGGAALGDIGRLFPDTDPDLAGASSERFVRECLERVEHTGFSVNNVDATIIAEAPRLTPHIVKIVERISKMLKVPTERISLKATTHEGLGLIGKGEAIAAMCVVGLCQRG